MRDLKNGQYVWDSQLIIKYSIKVSFIVSNSLCLTSVEKQIIRIMIQKRLAVSIVHPFKGYRPWPLAFSEKVLDEATLPSPSPAEHNFITLLILTSHCVSCKPCLIFKYHFLWRVMYMVEDCKKLTGRFGIKKIHYFNSLFFVDYAFTGLAICEYMFYRWLYLK